MEFVVKDASEREAICKYLQSLPDGKAYKVSITLHKAKRSNDANALYWAWLAIIASETGNDRETCHKFFAKKFLGYDVHEFGNDKIAVVRSTSRLDTKAFSEYMDQVSAFASSELGIVLPSPDDQIYQLINNE